MERRKYTLRHAEIEKSKKETPTNTPAHTPTHIDRRKHTKRQRERERERETCLGESKSRVIITLTYLV